MIVTLRNKTKQMQVYQLQMTSSTEEYPGRSQTVFQYEGEGTLSQPTQKRRLRHGPVIRFLAGEEKELPASMLHDPILKAALAGPKPALVIVKKVPAPKKAIVRDTADKPRKNKG